MQCAENVLQFYSSLNLLKLCEEIIQKLEPEEGNTFRVWVKLYSNCRNSSHSQSDRKDSKHLLTNDVFTILNNSSKEDKLLDEEVAVPQHTSCIHSPTYLDTC